MIALAEDLVDLLGFTVGDGVDLGLACHTAQIGGEPGLALLQPTLFDADPAGHQLDKIARVVAVSRQTPFGEQADLLDGQVDDLDVRAEQQEFSGVGHDVFSGARGSAGGGTQEPRRAKSAKVA